MMVFLLSPAVFFFTLTPPVMAFNFDFFKYFIPFIALNSLVTLFGNWGIPTRRSEQYYVASAWLFLRSIWSVLKGKGVAFNVTSKRREARPSAYHARPHLFIVGITLAGIAYNAFLIQQNIHPSFSGFVANCIWGGFNIYQLNAFIRAAHWKHA
jgi:cellulose synthase (UDP-forming)